MNNVKLDGQRIVVERAGERSKPRERRGPQDEDPCFNCGKKGHWKKVCLARLAGQPARPAPIAAIRTLSITPLSSDSAAEVAALKDMVVLMQKQQADFLSKLSQGF